MFLQNPLGPRISKTKFPTQVSFLFIFYLWGNFEYTFDARNLSLFVPVAMLSLYWSPINCRSIKIEGNLKHKVNYCVLPRCYVA
jgi:hypothetical protein